MVCVPVESFPELLAGAHEPAVDPEPIAHRGFFSPAFWLGAGIVWSFVVGAFWWQSILDWPNVVDGVLIARLRTIGGISLVAAGITLVNQQAGGLAPENRERFQRQIRQRLTRLGCDEHKLDALLRLATAVTYVYRDRDGAQVATAAVTPADCRRR